MNEHDKIGLIAYAEAVIHLRAAADRVTELAKRIRKMHEVFSSEQWKNLAQVGPGDWPTVDEVNAALRTYQAALAAARAAWSALAAPLQSLFATAPHLAL